MHHHAAVHTNGPDTLITGAAAMGAIKALFARPDLGPVLWLGIETLGSLVAVLVLYRLAIALKLGGDLRIRDVDHARRLANEAIEGFTARDVALDRARIGALVRNGAGQVLLIRRHGARFVALALGNHEGIRLDRQFLTLPSGDRQLGPITLDLGPDAQIWAASLRRLGERRGSDNA